MITDNNTTRKHCYWLDDEIFLRLKEQMKKRGIEMVQAWQNPCEALKDEIGYAEPQVWDVICRHDAAPWYHASRHAGKYLVISSFTLDKPYDRFLETTFEQSSFTPAAFPSHKDQMKLAEDQNYRFHEPQGWGKFPKEMGEAIVKGLEKMTEASFGDFSDLLKTWTAVHANFVTPRFRAGDEYMNAPYSIADTCHISSCCVELFNLLAAREPALLVRPCIGSVIVKVLEKDCYYLVRIQNSQ